MNTNILASLLLWSREEVMQILASYSSLMHRNDAEFSIFYLSTDRNDEGLNQDLCIESLGGDFNASIPADIGPNNLICSDH